MTNEEAKILQDRFESFCKQHSINSAALMLKINM